jgi:hypothetical protein
VILVCLRSAAIILLNDFIRGPLPHFVKPPELKDDLELPEGCASSGKEGGIEHEAQDADQVGIRNLKNSEPVGSGTCTNRQKRGKKL